MPWTIPWPVGRLSLGFIFRSGVQALTVRAQVQSLEKNLRTLGVLYFLLVVEGQGTHPRASGIRKQLWVSGADAGDCHAWKAAGKMSKDIAYQ